MPTNKELEQQTRDAQARVDALADRVGGLETSVQAVENMAHGLDAKLDHVLNALTGMTAKDRGTGTRPEFDARDVDDPQDGLVAQFKQERPVIHVEEPELELPRVLDVNSPEFRKKEQELAFMRERLDIAIHETSEEDSDQVFEVAVNGRGMLFHRGREYTGVPRYIVAGLAMARPVTFKNELHRLGDGTEAYRYPSRRGLRYGFSVLHDPSGERGRAWLTAILQQP